MEMHKYFQSKGIESFVAYATENTDASNDPNIYQIGSTLDHKLHALAYRVDHKQGLHSNLATKHFIKKIKQIAPDVVILHNLHSNYINIAILSQFLKEEHIYTMIVLHDCWFFTGGCYHYTQHECRKWLNECKECKVFGKIAAVKYQINKKIMSDLKPSVIAISKWIEQEARQSEVFNKCNISMIYNWIDLENFYPRNNNKVREKLNIEDRTMILGVSTGWSKNKGLLEMVKLAEKLADAYIVLVGHQLDKEEFPENMITIEFTDNKAELAELYSAADVFVNPSIQETFGLVTAESLACGTPIVVYNKTACPEFVSEYTGIAINDGSELIGAVNAILDTRDRVGNSVIQQKCVEFVQSRFNREENIEKYIQVLNSSVKQRTQL